MRCMVASARRSLLADMHKDAFRSLLAYAFQTQAHIGMLVGKQTRTYEEAVCVLVFVCVCGIPSFDINVRETAGGVVSRDRLH